MIKKGTKIAEPKGKVGVLIPGMGAVATTFVAGVEAIKNNLAQPIGSWYLVAGTFATRHVMRPQSDREF